MQPTKATHATTIILAVILLIIGIFGLAYFSQYKPVLFSPDTAVKEPTLPIGGINTAPERATLTGTQVCLPHRDTTGPQTMECAIGMKTADGKYYALDFNLMSQTPPVIPGGQVFSVSGILTPTAMLSSDHWQKYNMEGIFSVTDSVIIQQ